MIDFKNKVNNIVYNLDNITCDEIWKTVEYTEKMKVVNEILTTFKNDVFIEIYDEIIQELKTQILEK
jgi:hypothetical protein